MLTHLANIICAQDQAAGVRLGKPGGGLLGAKKVPGLGGFSGFKGFGAKPEPVVEVCSPNPSCAWWLYEYCK
jgi:hypothetical protein